ncbi:MAG TPA: penicillin-binding protein [Candidatus Sumerlaeota bacterium]|nr:penicillin-binding protein [Candidatus Sumerlaeota bacterium]HPS00891.1 penicillin-binding protein [Candidatus Sumerlaeota bacterium]
MAEPHPMETRYLHRTILVAMGFSLFFGLIVARLWFLQVYAHDDYVNQARKQQNITIDVEPRRASIYSSNGDPLAISVPRKSVYLEPEYLEESEDPAFPANLARDLARCVYGDELSEAELQTKADAFATRMRLQNDLKLKGTDEAKTTETETLLKGVVNGQSRAFLRGKILGQDATLSGEVKNLKPITLQGKVGGKTEVTFSGEAMKNRSITLTGEVEGRTLELKGFLAWRPRFLVGRRLDDEKVEQLDRLIKKYELPAQTIRPREEWERNYPNGSLAAHAIGLTRSDDYGDNIGASGVERQFSEDLQGNLSTYTMQAAFRQSLAPLDEAAYTSATGNHVYLTLNKAIQQYAEEALAQRIGDPEIRAKAGVCLVQEIETGAILAMASYPTFDLNAPPSEVPRNRCIGDAIQPGSVMKIFTSMALLENNKMSPYEIIDCDNKVHVFDVGRSKGYRVVDSHSVGVVPVMRAFAESSNIGFVKLGLRLEKDEFYRQLQRLHFGERTGIDLPGENPGRLYPVDTWTIFSRISVSFGYELMVTPIQVISAVSAIANGGHYMRPYILKEVRSPRNEILRRQQPEDLGKICEPETAKILMSMMEQVVVSETGSGKGAAVPGYHVGGKTGTTRKDDKPDEDSPENRYYSSFTGIIPLDHPKIAIYCWLDEPQGKTIYGGKVAAPVFQRVAEHAMRVLAIPPDPVLLAEAVAKKEKEKKNDTEKESRPRKNKATETSQTLTAGMDYLPKPMPVPEGTMPDLTGLTLAEAVERVQALDLDMKLKGTGVVMQQEPLPGTPIKPAMQGLITFDSPEKLTGKMRNPQ